MNKEIINAPKGVKYLSEFMTSLPVNCLFDKGVTGCGGTELALTNDIDTIIAMPYVSLIKNKKSKHNDRLLGVYGDTETDEIISYMMQKGKKKIAVTYDSLERLVKILIDMGINVFDHFFLLVDEWHILFNSYVFRNKAIKKVLSLVKQFRNVTYMTATPIEEEFILEELKGIPVVEVKWQDTKPILVNPVVTNNPLKVICSLIEKVKEDKIFGNLHIFVNSVDFIKKVLESTETDQVRIICSKNNRLKKGKLNNFSKLDKYAKYIGDTTDPVKRINFYTSTCFEGCDIYDPNGKTIVVSDGRKAQTLLDISTLFIQICGRIRDSRYNIEVTHIFTETKYDNYAMTLDEYREISYKQLSEVQFFVNEVNNMTERNRMKIIEMIQRNKKECINEDYITYTENKLVLDKNLVKVDIMNYKVRKCLYHTCNNLIGDYIKNGFDVSKIRRLILATDKLKANPNAKVSFKDLFLEYAAIREAQKGLIHFGNAEERQYLIERDKPLVKDAYEILGIERVKQLEYLVTHVKREILKLSNLSLDSKIYYHLLDIGIKPGTEYLTCTLKILLQAIYNLFGKKANAKASDIGKWFEFKRKTKKIEGKSTEYISILKEKMIYE